MMPDFIFTSESVTDGHPDKLCDQISDAIVDQYLREDPQAHVIAECAASTGILFIATHFASRAMIDVSAVARRIIAQVGYDQPDFNARTCSVMTSLNQMPALDAASVDEREMSEAELEHIPARNQVTVFGFACTETPALMPLPIALAHRLAARLAAARQDALPYLAPDGKVQVSVEYRARRPVRIHSLTLIAALTAPQGHNRLCDDLMTQVVAPVFASEPVAPDATTRIAINPGGQFLIGGPAKHSGLTGRKTAVDTYGEYARHSGAALSGKGPGRIDRIGAYAARYAAKNVVAAGLAEQCEVQLSYSIGLSRPVSVQVDAHGTARIPEPDIAARILRHFDFRPAGIIRKFNLRHLPAASPHGFYRRLGAYGHMGRLDLDLPWEAIDKAGALGADVPAP